MAVSARAISLSDAAAREADDLSPLYPALSAELAALADMAEGLQAATGALAAAQDGNAPTAHRYNLQTLDLLTQRLHALAGFFAAMPDVQQAIGRITLSDLARRLKGEETRAAPPSDEFELF